MTTRMRFNSEEFLTTKSFFILVSPDSIVVFFLHKIGFRSSNFVGLREAEADRTEAKRGRS